MKRRHQAWCKSMWDNHTQLWLTCTNGWSRVSRPQILDLQGILKPETNGLSLWSWPLWLEILREEPACKDRWSRPEHAQCLSLQKPRCGLSCGRFPSNEWAARRSPCPHSSGNHTWVTGIFKVLDLEKGECMIVDTLRPASTIRDTNTGNNLGSTIKTIIHMYKCKKIHIGSGTLEKRCGWKYRMGHSSHEYDTHLALASWTQTLQHIAPQKW